ncbi:MAG: 2OG-Fe(II) oxygenase family protein [Anaerolineae bacterium]
MVYLTEYLEEPTEEVAKSVSSAYNLVRLAYYPAPTEDLEAVWARAHKDLNCITLLPPSTIPGLQLQTKEGEWKAVNVPQGYLIINTGEQLQLKTAGMIQATLHQVINPGGKYAHQRRFASIFFASWSPDFSLSPYQSCIDKMTIKMSEPEKENYLKQFPDITVQENLSSRLIEMKTIPNPEESLVLELRRKGLLRTPPQDLIDRFPHIFVDN